MFLIANFDRIRALSTGSERISSRSASSPAVSSGSSWARRSSASVAAVSTRVPLGSTRRIDSTVLYELCRTPQAIPLALLAITPPTHAAALLAGSGPRIRPNRATRAFARARMAPDSARSRCPSSSTVTLSKCRRTSSRMSSPCDCPLRLVPAARRMIRRLVRVAKRNTPATSRPSRATTTTRGTRR